VDDNASVRIAVSRMLTAHGADVSTFATCEEAGSLRAGSPPPDDLIVDALMCKGGCKRVIEEAMVRGMNDTQIVMMLSAAQLQAGVEAIAGFGVKRYLVKPVFEEKLIELLTRRSDATGESSRQSKEAPAIRPLRVLVAEDNLINQRVVSRFLERDGHSLLISSNGREAVDAFQRQAFDVILMDVQMPEMDGITATREIRRLERPIGSHTPIIALTAHSVEGDRERCIDAGMDGFVSKPIKIDELRQALVTARLTREGQAA